MSTKPGQARLSRSGGWWVGGWVRNTGNKAQLRPALAGALPELGKSCHKSSQVVTSRHKSSQGVKNCQPWLQIIPSHNKLP